MKEQKPKLGRLQHKSTDDRKFHDPLDSKADELWRSKMAKLTDSTKFVIVEKAKRIAMGKEEKKRVGKRRTREKEAEKREDIKVYGEPLD